jgi:hypothetical protein
MIPGRCCPGPYLVFQFIHKLTYPFNPLLHVRCSLWFPDGLRWKLVKYINTYPLSGTT